MNFLLDENVPRDACKLLREKGHQCRTIADYNLADDYSCENHIYMH